MSRRRIVGPIFFMQTITAARYISDILEPFIALLNEDEIEYSWFQQDSAPAHTSHICLRFLEDVFADRVITHPLWPPRSPDLTPLDFYLWGELKGKVYEQDPQDLNDLRAAISAQINQISEQNLEDTFANLVKRVQLCRETQGGGSFLSFIEKKETKDILLPSPFQISSSLPSFQLVIF